MAVIKLTLGEEVQPKIEKYEDFGTSMFKDVYVKSFKLLSDIKSASLIYYSNKNKIRYYNEELNNIIAFVGERGSGKSSCMLSFMESLRSDSAIFELKRLLEDANGTKDLKNNEQVKSQISYKQLDDESYKFNASDFHISDIIDPSFFDQSCNILDIILGKLFKSFKDDSEKRKCNIDEDYSQKKRELIGYFQKTKEQVDAMMDKNKKSNDSLDCLLKLSSGTELKDTIRELVDAYLNYFGHNPKEGERFLVIPIDDIDLNTEHAYKMVEQVRKYFIQPNVVILMAVKLDQLQDVVMKSYNAEFKDVKDQISDSVELMAERYITKLIPYEHRLYLPDLELSLNSKLEIVGLVEEENPIVLTTVRDSVLSLIYSRTRFLFYNSPQCTSPIVPTNLRDLVELLAMLAKMDAAKKDGSIVRPYNQILFKKYFIESWCKSKLRDKDYKFIKELLKTEVVRKNKFTISYITDSFEQLKESLSKDKDKYKNEIGKIINKDNLTYNVSLGDVLYVLNTIKNLDDKTNTLNFVFAVKSVYSIFLYELYDEWCDILNHPKDNNKEVFNIKDSLNYPEYFKLIGGAYINSYEHDRIIPYEEIESRIYRNISDNSSKINDLVNQLESGKISTKDLNLLEILLLSTTSTDRVYYRLDSECRYSLQLKSFKSKSVYFDAISVLFNFLRIYNSLISEYLSFLSCNDITGMIANMAEKKKNTETDNTETDNFLYNILKNNEKSIIYRVLINCINRNENPSILSAICIRNIEVLEALINSTSKTRGPSNLEHLNEFWKSLANFEILSEDVINFSFLKELKVFDKKDELIDVNEFEKIYIGRIQINKLIEVKEAQVKEAQKKRSQKKRSQEKKAKEEKELKERIDEGSTLKVMDINENSLSMKDIVPNTPPLESNKITFILPDLSSFKRGRFSIKNIGQGFYLPFIKLNSELLENKTENSASISQFTTIVVSIFGDKTINKKDITQEKLDQIKKDFEDYLNKEEEQS